ncbi:histidine kinase [Pontibacillus sp. ALD_SL1]|uniref:sensor histidine kinase n=1 Tax=Pontibacillus sp. ALD_SL1 TaxID=2777185 RepID=UPI001A95DC6C|nr:sensor histidine kinase [Pontibacillus sp. ALD_SL1]QST01732.1 histidine kinase [Pontibacillus sp. ALD_SL1]
MKNDLFHRRSIQSKLLWVIIIFVCTPLLVFGYIWYERTTTAIQDNAVHASQQLLNQTKEYLSFYLADLKKATTPLLSSTSIQNYLKSNHTPDTRYEQYIETKRIQEEIFGQILNGRSDIFGLSLISKDGRQEHNYSQVKEFIDIDEIKKRNIDLWNNHEQFESYELLDLKFYKSTPILTIVQKIYDKNTYETIGLLIVNLHLSQIASILNEITDDHFNEVWLVNEDDTIIYHPLRNQLGQPFQSDYTKENISYITQHDKQKTLLVQESLPNTNWMIMASVPLEEAMTRLVTLRNFTILVGLILIGLAILFVGGFSFTLTYSLQHLQKLMREVASGKFPTEKPRPLALYQEDEISDLYNSFYSMTEKLSELIQQIRLSKLKEQELHIKTKEAELQAMQSQINPHFLYNTLEIINSYAIIEDQMEISRMTTSLADMFRYNVSNTKKVVSLEEELQHIKAYFQIQLERFEGLNVSIEVDESLTSNVLIPRLTIQPIIENAFSHGYEEHSLVPTFIGIYGKKVNRDYLLYLVDHGKGMVAETTEAYNYAFIHNTEPPEDYRTTKRIGLLNVHKRIHSELGFPYGLFIKKSNQSGTVIEIRLPLRMEDTIKEA